MAVSGTTLEFVDFQPFHVGQALGLRRPPRPPLLDHWYASESAVRSGDPLSGPSGHKLSSLQNGWRCV